MNAENSDQAVEGCLNAIVYGGGGFILGVGIGLTFLNSLSKGVGVGCLLMIAALAWIRAGGLQLVILKPMEEDRPGDGGDSSRRVKKPQTEKRCNAVRC